MDIVKEKHISIGIQKTHIVDGTGYSRGMNASQLSFEERLMACIDIYQALTEDRPYKAGTTHESWQNHSDHEKHG